MQFPALAAALLGALSLADALHVPVGTPDGIYDVVEGDDGEPILTKIGDLVDGIIGGDEIRPRQPAGFSRIQKRADYGCYPFSLIRNDIQRAATNLGNTCDAGAKIPRRGSEVAVANDVVAYACNSARFSRKPCYSSDLNFAVAVLEEHCPVNRAGQFTYGTTSHKGASKKYGYTLQGKPICR